MMSSRIAAKAEIVGRVHQVFHMARRRTNREITIDGVQYKTGCVVSESCLTIQIGTEYNNPNSTWVNLAFEVSGNTVNAHSSVALFYDKKLAEDLLAYIDGLIGKYDLTGIDAYTDQFDRIVDLADDMFKKEEAAV